MKIVKRNEKKAPKKWSGRFVCGDCTSVLDVEEDDLARYAAEAWNYAAFVCLCCSAANKVVIPDSVFVRLQIKGAGGKTVEAKQMKLR